MCLRGLTTFAFTCYSMGFFGVLSQIGLFSQGEENEVKIGWWSRLTVLAVATQLEEAVIVDAGSLPLPQSPLILNDYCPGTSRALLMIRICQRLKLFLSE